MMDVLVTLIVVLVSQVCRYVTPHLIANFKSIQFSISINNTVRNI